MEGIISNQDQIASAQPIPHGGNVVMSRRNFITLFGGTIAASVLAGEALDAVQGVLNRNNNEIPVYNQPQQPEMQVSGLVLSEELSGDIEHGETESLFEVRDDFTLIELAEHAAKTNFGDNDPARITETTKAILDAKDEFEAEYLTDEAIFRMTGRRIYYNTVPGTNTPLPATRMDMPLESYQTSLSDLVRALAGEVRQLASLPTSYNIVKEHLPDKTPDQRDSINKSIAGMVTDNGEADYLSLDMGSMVDPLWHEFHHVWQFQHPKYSTESDYAQLCIKGRQFEQLKDLTTMYKEVERLRAAEIAKGNKEALPVFFIADSLIGHEAARNEDGEVSGEDESSTLSTTIAGGLIPEQRDHKPEEGRPTVLGYLRDKQIQALKDFSIAAGANMSAQLAIHRRFGRLFHPKTLASMHGKGILENISPLEAGQFSNIPEQSPHLYTGNKLAPGTHFVNIGTSEKPEIVALTASNTSQEPDNPETNNGVFDILVNFRLDEDRELLNLGDTPPPTTVAMTEITQPVERTPEEAYYDSLTREGQLVDDFVKRFAPGLQNREFSHEGGYYYTNADNGPASFDQTENNNRTLRVTIDAVDLHRHIKSNALVGWINDKNVFEAF